MPELKPLTKEALSRALEKAERYRLLKEPEQAESICQDVLLIEPDINAVQQRNVSFLIASKRVRPEFPQRTWPH